MSGEAIRRRELRIGIQRVELRPYRRTRTSSDILTSPPHFVYTIRFEWQEDPLPRTASPRMPSPRDSKRLAGFEEPWPWWDSLPKSYTLRKRWTDILRFHESLKLELANDPILDCRRVKAKVPALPHRADVDAWLKTYAATNDACALNRSCTEVSNKEFVGSFKELGDLHWMYCHNRLAPYFREATKVLEEVPTEVLASSRGLRRFVTGGVSRAEASQAYLGKLQPVVSEEQLMARRLGKSLSLGILRKTTDVCP